MSAPRDAPPMAPVSVGPADPADVHAEVRAVVHGFIEGDWSGIERVEVGGVARPLVESLGNVPITDEYADLFGAHDGIADVEPRRAAAVETTTRGPFPGNIVGVELTMEDATITLSYAGWGWYAFHPSRWNHTEGPIP